MKPLLLRIWCRVWHGKHKFRLGWNIGGRELCERCDCWVNR